METDERQAKKKARDKAYHIAHRKEILARKRACYAANRGRKKAYYMAHREEISIQKREHYLSHKTEYQARCARYQAEHREGIRRQRAEYRKENRAEIAVKDAARHAVHVERRRATAKISGAAYRKSHYPEAAAYASARRALKAGALIGATAAQLAEIKQIYRRAKEDKNVRCYLCGKKIPLGHRHVDHIVPLSKGGAHRPSNLAVACDKCNLSKGGKLPHEVGVLL